jgi:lipoate-protein ligase A
VHENQVIKFIAATLQTPAGNLACDEALLDLCDKTGDEILRVWESPMPFVVVGYGNHVGTEVNLDACRHHGVPVLRRCSGGGTVVQGPGCLSYAICLQVRESGDLTTVTGTNRFVMEKTRAAIANLLNTEVSIQGHTDLAIRVARGWLKFSGNAQRRRRKAVLFHGTVLHDADLASFAKFLHPPSQQPEYRAGRPHAEFMTNIAAAADEVTAALRAAWEASQILDSLPAQAIDALVRTRYGTHDWNFSR